MSSHLSPASVNALAFLKKSLFGALPDDELRALSEQAVIEDFPAEHCIQPAGRSLQHLRLVIEGGISVTSKHISGKELLISIEGPGSWVAWLPCFVGRPLATDYTALAGSVFIALPVAAVRRCFGLHPQLYPMVMVEIGHRMRLLMEWTTQSVLLIPEQRLARLLSLLARNRKMEDRVTLQVTQSHLADLMGCSRQSVSRLVAKLEARDLIRMSYGKCEIRDVAALRDYSEAESL